MQFLWSHWRKTHIKKIKIAHRDCPKSATEEIVLSYKGNNYIWNLFYYKKGGSIWRTGKRHSKISSRRWKSHEIVVTRFLGSLSGYTILEVDCEIILEIYRFWERYFKNRGIEDPGLFGSVIEEDESQDS